MQLVAHKKKNTSVACSAQTADRAAQTTARAAQASRTQSAAQKAFCGTKKLQRSSVFKAIFSCTLALSLASACFGVPTFSLLGAGASKAAPTAAIPATTPTLAWATGSSNNESSPAGSDSDSSELSDLEKQVQQSAQTYNSAVSRQEELADQIEELDSKISQLEEELPQKQAQSDESIVALYKYSADSASVVQMLLDSTSIIDMLALADQYTWVIDRHLSIVQEAQNMKNDLNQSRTLLQSDKAQADDAASSAASALEQAKAAREKAAEEAAAKQAAQAQAANSSAEERLKNATTDEEREAAREELEQSKKSASSSSADNVNWSSDKSAFVNEWAGRINDYLSGSPTAGTGTYYAAAAWDYGVDPRWAPAISCIESSKGAACFRSHNAWGFGGRSFSSWQDGITTVVRCLGGSLYGGHLTQEAAQNYCPPTWQSWYNNVSSEMSKI